MAGYTPLFNTIITSSIWSEDSDTRVVWVTMLAMADKDGAVYASLPGLARAANVPLGVCQKAIDLFLKPDQYSRTAAEDGRRIAAIPGGWYIINHNLYRNKAKSRAEYFRQYRQNKKNPPIPPLKNNTNYKQITTPNSDTSPQHAHSCATVAPKLKEVVDFCALVGVPQDKAEYFFNHYNAVGWLDPAGRPITSWESMLLKWKAKGYQYEELKSKQAKADDGMAKLRAKYEKEKPPQ